jgi:tRNA pseudouridine55 synthase
MTGFIAVNKAEGFTSFDVCAIIRKALGEKRVGHTGTLDPMAAGVLPVLVGRATVAADILPDTDKTYFATLKFGIATDTEDITGRITETSDKRVTEEELKAILSIFSKPRIITQIPPMYSAVKVGGERLYDIARRGGTAERKPREVTIYSATAEDFNFDEQTAAIAVSCSAGTYIRTFIDTIGRKLGTFATMTALTRTKANGIPLSECTDIREIKAHPETASSLLRPIESLFEALPVIKLDNETFALYRNGVKVNIDCADGSYRICNPNQFIGIGKVTKQILKAEKYFVI